MGLTQQQIDALRAEDAQLAAQEAQDAAAVQTTYPASTTPGKIATFHFPAGDSPAAPATAGDLLTMSMGAVPTPTPAQAAEGKALAALTPEQIAKLKEEDAKLAAEDEKASAPTGRLAKLWESVSEKVNPTKTEAEGGVINPELEKYPDWTHIAQPLDHPINTARAALGTLISNIDETADVIKEQFPGAKVEKAGKFGQYLKIQPAGSDQIYTYKPGLRKSDLARAAIAVPVAGSMAAATGALASLAVPGTILSGLGSALAGATGLELQKYAAGGGFNPNNVAGAGVFHQGQELAGKAIGGAVNAIRGSAPEVGGVLAGAEGAAIQPPAVPAAPAMQTAELGKAMAKAGRGISGAGEAVAGQVNPNPELLAAARTLKGPDGSPLIESLTPAQISQNPRFQSLANAASGATDTHATAVQGMGGVLTHALDVAGARPSAAGGALATAAKEGVENQLEAYRRLGKEIYARLDGAEAVAADAAKGIEARPAVAGIVPKDLKVDVSPFNAVVDAAEKELGTLPKPAEKFRAELFSGGEIPTRSMVDRMRRKAGDDIGKHGGKLGLDLAHKFYNALDGIYSSSAENFSPGAADLVRQGKNVSQVLRDAEEITASVLGDRLQNNLTDKVTEAVANLPHGPSDEFARTLSVAPARMRPGLVKYALRQFVDRNGSLDVRGLNDWYRAMEQSPDSWRALKLYAGEDLAGQLESTAKISRNVEAAIRAAKPRDFAGTFPEPFDLPAIARKGIALRAMGAAPLIPAEAKYELSGRIIGTKTPLGDAIAQYLSSPIAREFMTAETKGAVPDGLVRSTLSNGLFRNMMDLANIPVHARRLWLQSPGTGQQQEAK